MDCMDTFFGENMPHWETFLPSIMGKNLFITYKFFSEKSLGSTLCIIVSLPDLARELFKIHDTAIPNHPTATARHFTYNIAGFTFAPYDPYRDFVEHLCMSELLGPRIIDLHPVKLLEILRTILDKSAHHEPIDMSSKIIKMSNNEVTRMAANTSSRTGGETKDARELVKHATELIRAFNIADYIIFCKNLDLQGQGEGSAQKIRCIDGEDHNGERENEKGDLNRLD